MLTMSTLPKNKKRRQVVRQRLKNGLPDAVGDGSGVSISRRR
jgi:hypothetical protein